MDSRNEELRPGYRRVKNTSAQGIRKVIISPVSKTDGTETNIFNVDIPKLNENEVILTDEMFLIFKFKNSNTKSWFKNNLASLLCEQLTVQMAGKVVYQNIGEGIFERYKDLWKSDAEREQMLEYGVASENMREIMSGDDSADTTDADDVLPEKYQGVLKIKIGKVLEGYGPYAPYTVQDVRYQIKFSKSSEIMLAQTSQKVGTFKLEEIFLQSTVIINKDLAKTVSSEYTSGRQLWFDHVTRLSQSEWGKDSVIESVRVNKPYRSLKAIVLLFTKANPDDSEEFINPKIKKVSVSIGGVPNSVYSHGLERWMIYEEAKRFFGKSGPSCFENVSKLNFLKSKYTLVIDMRTVNQQYVIHTGRRIVGSQSGVFLNIEKDKMDSDLMCYVFGIADGNIVIKNRMLVEDNVTK